MGFEPVFKFAFPPCILHYEPKNEIAPFSRCPPWFLKLVPNNKKQPKDYVFSTKSAKITPSNAEEDDIR